MNLSNPYLFLKVNHASIDLGQKWQNVPFSGHKCFSNLLKTFHGFSTFISTIFPQSSQTQINQKAVNDIDFF